MKRRLQANAEIHTARADRGAVVSARVVSGDTGARLAGGASAALIRESEAAAPTGMVPAYYDAARGLWDYVAPSEQDHYRRNLGIESQTVYVEVQS